MGHLAANDHLAEAWKADIGAGGGYRRMIMAQPVVRTASSSPWIPTPWSQRLRLTARQPALALRHQAEDDATAPMSAAASGVDGSTLYAVNGLSTWSRSMPRPARRTGAQTSPAPARSAPTIADGRVFVTTIDDQLLAFTAADGRPLWTHQAAEPVTSMLGQPAPAYCRGLVVAGFGSGELACLRADSGSVVWTDSLGASAGTASIADLSVDPRRCRSSATVGSTRSAWAGCCVVHRPALRPPAVGARGRRRGQAYLAGDWLFVISAEQQIAAVNADDGRVAWVTQLPRWENPDKQQGHA